MTRWRLAPCAWTDEGDSVIAVSLRAPLQNPLRLEGTASICWAAFAEFEEGVGATDLARTILGDSDAEPPAEIVRGIAEFLDRLVDAGIAVIETEN